MVRCPKLSDKRNLDLCDESHYQQNKEYDQSLIKNFKENIEQELKASVIERAKVKRNGKWVDVRSIIYG